MAYPYELCLRVHLAHPLPPLFRTRPAEVVSVENRGLILERWPMPASHRPAALSAKPECLRLSIVGLALRAMPLANGNRAVTNVADVGFPTDHHAVAKNDVGRVAFAPRIETQNGIVVWFHSPIPFRPSTSAAYVCIDG